MTEDEEKMLQNWRGRRFMAVRLHNDLEKLIDSLGIEDGSVLTIDRPPLPEVGDAVKLELKNMLTCVFRMTIAINDGGASQQRMKMW